jgi:hypothetical protein
LAGFGRLLAFGGLAAAGLTWFGRRRKRDSTPEEERMARYPADIPPDPIDEAGAESFPASDPPSYAGSESSAETQSETTRR